MRKGRVKLSPQTLEAASAWFVDFNEGDVDSAGRKEFNTWLRASPEHVRAYLQVSAFWEDAEVLGKRERPDLAILRELELPEENVFPLAPSRSRGRPAESVMRPRRVLIAASLIAVLSIAALGSWWHLQRSPTYSTGIGEQRSIALADGTTIELNSRSQLRVRYSATERNVQLLEGQALFRVGKDSKRPFVVSSGVSRVQAIGTQFDVYEKDAGTVVTVLQGRVAVRIGEHNDTTVLDAGEQATVTPTAVRRPMKPNVTAATAWTQRQLIFESAPLEEIAQEFNRYNPRKIVITGTGLKRFHVSGVFPSTDPQRFVEFLRQRFGVQVRETEDEIRVDSKK